MIRKLVFSWHTHCKGNIFSLHEYRLIREWGIPNMRLKSKLNRLLRDSKPYFKHLSASSWSIWKAAGTIRNLIIDQSIHQSINQANKQSSNQASNPSINHLINQSIYDLTNRSINARIINFKKKITDLPAGYIGPEDPRLYGLYVAPDVCLRLHNPPVLCHLVQHSLVLVREHNVHLERLK